MASDRLAAYLKITLHEHVYALSRFINDTTIKNLRSSPYINRSYRVHTHTRDTEFAYHYNQDSQGRKVGKKSPASSIREHLFDVTLVFLLGILGIKTVFISI